MKFSFITCTYNRAMYLSETLQSLCNQTYNPKEFEIIIIDNNSTDHTTDICMTFLDRYPTLQIRYFKEEQQGLSFALNRGINEAIGEFLIYVDDDETIQKKHLHNINNHITNYSDITLIASPVIPIYEISEPKWMSPFTQRLIGGYFYPQKTDGILRKSYPGTGHTIIKKELYEKYGFYNTELGRTGNSLMGAEDKDLMFRLKKNNIKCYYFQDIPIYHHIPAYKLTDIFFDQLTYSIGKSERIRTQSVSKKSFYKRLINESIKWIASFLLCLYYILCLRPSKGLKLLRFRLNVTKGLLSK